MHDERQEWINKRAYGLWEAHGRPHGKDHEHWEQAARERAELERVALPEHLKKNNNSDQIDDATKAAVDLTRQALSEDSDRETSPREEHGGREAANQGPFDRAIAS